MLTDAAKDALMDFEVDLERAFSNLKRAIGDALDERGDDAPGSAADALREFAEESRRAWRTLREALAEEAAPYVDH